jgi:hypothetical protein
MFIYYFAHIPQPFAQLAEPFENHPESWLPGCVARACDEAGQTAIKENRGPCPTTVAVGPVSRSEGSRAVSIRVESAAPGVLFTHLEADLEIGDLGPSQTQLTLRGSYRGPSRVAGVASDGLRHRRAEAFAKAMVEQVADRLTVPGLAAVPAAKGRG